MPKQEYEIEKDHVCSERIAYIQTSEGVKRTVFCPVCGEDLNKKEDEKGK